jgi:hypothetical protein
MNTTHPLLQQLRIATALAVVDGTDVTGSHWDAAGGLMTYRREVFAALAAVENDSAAVTVAVGDRIRAVLIRNGGSAALSVIAKSLSRRNRPHMQRVLDELVATGSMTYDAETRVYRIAS